MAVFQSITAEVVLEGGLEQIANTTILWNLRDFVEVRAKFWAQKPPFVLPSLPSYMDLLNGTGGFSVSFPKETGKNQNVWGSDLTWEHTFSLGSAYESEELSVILESSPHKRDSQPQSYCNGALFCFGKKLRGLSVAIFDYSSVFSQLPCDWGC